MHPKWGRNRVFQFRYCDTLPLPGAERHDRPLQQRIDSVETRHGQVDPTEDQSSLAWNDPDTSAEACLPVPGYTLELLDGVFIRHDRHIWE